MTDTMLFLLLAAAPTLWLYAKIIEAALQKKAGNTCCTTPPQDIRASSGSILPETSAEDL